MMEKVVENWSKNEVGIFAAAVADYRPIDVSNQKIKKSESEFELKLTRNADILGWAAKNKSERQFIMGFALETNNSMENALSKLNAKKLDAIVLNSMESEVALDILNFIDSAC